MFDRKKIFYNSIAEDFDNMMNPFDLRRRIETVFNLLLPPDLAGLRLLEVGCGTGWFSKQAKERGADVVSLDIGHKLIQKTLERIPVHPIVADALYLPFKNDIFDIVLSSDVIEHTFEPKRAVGEMSRVLKRGGSWP